MKCAQCLNVTLVPTGKRHGQNVWDMNSKLGTAILFCGIGETVVNTLLCALDLPSVSPTTLKKREREAGIALEAVADDTCQDALREEKDRCENSDRAEAVSFEAGWQTRGSGRNYASLTGHGSMIGFNTGKIVAYSYRCKTCRFCQSTKDGPVKEHDCRKNWDKSSKAMESDMAIEMLQDLKQKGFHVKNDYGYDSTTFSRAKAVFDENIEKVCDFNHTKKNFTNRLFELRKEKKYSALGPKAIKHLTKCFAYAVKGNNDRESLESNLCAIPLHVSGDHSKCGNWCGFVQQPSSYKPRNLPYGKYLTGEDLIKDLQHIFDAFSKNAEELLNIGSTQGNESFNNIVFSKKPKEPLLWRLRVHAFRVAAAVAQKNIGNDAISKVYDHSLLSPGKNIELFLTRTSKKRQYKKNRKASTAHKKRRYELKSSMAKQESTAEVKEGTTYQPAVDLNPTTSSEATQEIPDATVPPTLKTVENGKNAFLYFDLETTGLGTSCDITQLACVTEEENFNRGIRKLNKGKTSNKCKYDSIVLEIAYSVKT
ncbi:uncharacterized protein LOC134266976 [Saccostrea cucullata]|uniref:uncharacterized protein LOC134266976 n=1 Tax=Saccostrea cuccullata TaxID=36930 RepID=UPI002ED4C7A6